MNFDIYQNPKQKGHPCTKENFLNTIHGEWLKEQIIRIRQAVQNGAEMKRIQELKAELPCVTWQAHCSTFNHTQKNCSPSGMYMIDIDHVDLQELRSHLDTISGYRNTYGVMAEHITPSGEGFRIVARILDGEEFDGFKSIEDWQKHLCKGLKLDGKFPIDKACKDLSRLSYLVPFEDFTYLDMALFSMPCPRQGYQLELFNQKKTNCNEKTNERTTEESAQSCCDDFTDTEKDFAFMGKKISEIAQMYVEKYGTPEIGTRHLFYLQMAGDIRHICNNNPRILLAQLPGFDKPFNERADVCKYVCATALNRNIPRKLFDVIKGLKNDNENEDADVDVDEDVDVDSEEYSFPKFPRIFSAFARVTPPKFMWAQMNTVACCLGANMNIQAVYLDNTVHTPTFHSVIVGDPGSGKSFAKRTVEKLCFNMRMHDRKSEAKEKQFLLEYKRTKNSKSPAQRPPLARRMPHAMISQVELLVRLDDNCGSHILFFLPELDTYAKSNKGYDKDDMFRQGWDNDEYGQDFKSENSFNGTVKLYMNVLATGTDGALYRVYKTPENGMVSRLTISSLGDQHFVTMPKFKTFTEKEENVIKDIVDWCEKTTYLDNKDAQVELIKPRLDLTDKCDFLNDTIEKWLEDKRMEAMRTMDFALDSFRKRCGVMGWRMGLVAIGCYKGQLNEQRKKIISDFACWCADQSLENLLLYYGEEERNIAIKGRRTATTTTTSIDAFAQLPQEFDASDVYTVAKKLGISSPIRNVIYRWRKNGLIKKIDKNKYAKL